MPSKKPALPPDIDFRERTPDELAEGLRGDLEEGAALELLRFTGLDLSDLDLSASSVLECLFEQVTFTGAELRASRIIETRFDAPFGHTFSATRTTWRDVRVDRPRWGSAELFESELESVHLRGGKIDYLNLRGSKLTNVLIEDCAIGDLDLGGCSATRVAFANCRVGTLDLTRATCSGVDLRTSEFAAVHGLDGLRGTIIDDLQLSLFAPLLAQHLGVTVEG